MHETFCLPSIFSPSRRRGLSEWAAVWMLSCWPGLIHNIQKIRNPNHALPWHQPGPKGMKSRWATSERLTTYSVLNDFCWAALEGFQMYRHLQEVSWNSRLWIFQVVFSLLPLWLPRLYSQSLTFSKGSLICYFLCLNPPLSTGEMSAERAVSLGKNN